MADLHDTVRIEPVPESSLLLETCSTLLSSKCCHNFLIDFNFDDHDCLKFALSKGLGYGIIVASTLVKLPQVVKILNAKSGAGISVFGTILELLAITFNASYSYGKKFPFAAWGEALFLLFETGLIAFLVLWYDKKKIRSILGVILYAGILYVLMSGRTPIDVLWKLQALNLPLAISGKAIQAVTNLRAGHTGQMSFVTITLLFLGCVARIYTSIQETGDDLVIKTYIVASAANLVLVAQVLWYWNATNAFFKKPTKKQQRKKRN